MALHAETKKQDRVQRYAYADNLKTIMVAAVIVAHVIIAWTGFGVWAMTEDPVREPMYSVLVLLIVVGALYGLTLFFVIAGMFTPASLRRKGPGRFAVDRLIRLGVPMVFFVIFLSPIVEYFDDDNVGWTGSFAEFAWYIWWPPAPGPTWFLGVLLVFSLIYAGLRYVVPEHVTTRTPMTVRHMVFMAAAITVTSYVVRIAVPLGEELWRLALGQAPAWVTAFTLGVIGGERGWFDSLTPAFVRASRRIAVASLGVIVGSFLVIALTDGDVEALFGGGTWQSLLIATAEGLYLISLSVWLLDVFQRRNNHQGRLAREMSRGAYAAFVIHQVVLVGLVLGTRLLRWPPEVDFLVVAALGVAISFGIGSLLVRLPGVRRVV